MGKDFVGAKRNRKIRKREDNYRKYKHLMGVSEKKNGTKKMKVKRFIKVKRLKLFLK